MPTTASSAASTTPDRCSRGRRRSATTTQTRPGPMDPMKRSSPRTVSGTTCYESSEGAGGASLAVGAAVACRALRRVRHVRHGRHIRRHLNRDQLLAHCLALPAEMDGGVRCFTGSHVLVLLTRRHVLVLFSHRFRLAHSRSCDRATSIRRTAVVEGVLDVLEIPLARRAVRVDQSRLEVSCPMNSWSVRIGTLAAAIRVPEGVPQVRNDIRGRGVGRLELLQQLRPIDRLARADERTRGPRRSGTPTGDAAYPVRERLALPAKRSAMNA